MTTITWKLISIIDGKQIAIGDEVYTKAGELFTIRAIAPPVHEASTGRVYTDKGGYFPAVFGLAFIAIEETI